MQKLGPKISAFIVLSSILLSTIHCTSPTPEVPPGVEVVDITNRETVTKELTLNRTFDQCDSSSGITVSVQFKELEKQGITKEFTLAPSGEAGVKLLEVVKLSLEAEIRRRIEESVAKEHGESVEIQVPAHVKQEYTFVWRETRREGTVQYKEDGKLKTAGYSYRIGLELVSSTGRDVPCPKQETPATPTKPSPAPTTAPASTVSAEQAIRDYYSLIEQKQYAVAWEMSEEFNLGEGISFGTYVDGWEESGPARVIELVNVVEVNDQATVTLTLYYPKKAVTHVIRYELARDTERGNQRFGYWIFVAGKVLQ